MGKMVFWEFYEVFTSTTQLLHFLKIEYMIVAMLTPRWATGIVLIYFVRVVKYVYLQCIDSHSAGDLVEDPFLSTRVCMEHGIETGKRRRSTKNTQKNTSWLNQSPSSHNWKAATNITAQWLISRYVNINKVKWFYVKILKTCYITRSLNN